MRMTLHATSCKYDSIFQRNIVCKLVIIIKGYYVINQSSQTASGIFSSKAMWGPDASGPTIAWPFWPLTETSTDTRMTTGTLNSMNSASLSGNLSTKIKIPPPPVYFADDRPIATVADLLPVAVGVTVSLPPLTLYGALVDTARTG